MKLDDLFNKYSSDKGSNHHNYSPVYEQILNSVKDKSGVLLEFGIGGYNYTDRGGGDLLAFREYLSNYYIHGVDIYDKSFLESEADIKTHIGSQTDADFITSLIYEIGNPSIIIDDASHNNYKTIRTFEICFPLLKEGGFYVIEDVHTSYWDSEEYQGSSDGDCVDRTTVNFFKNMVDTLNWEHISEKENYKNIEQWKNVMDYIHFYPKIIVVKKR